MTEDTNKLIKEVAFDIISMTTMWGLVSASNATLNNCQFSSENKYRNFSVSFQDITRLVAMGSSAIVLAKYFRS
jgi:hypothetical protein